MLFLFNDKLFDIEQPSEVINSDAFPLSPFAFEQLTQHEMLFLVREEIFADPLLVHDVPARAIQLATIVAAKTNANAMLAGPPEGGANTVAQIAVLLAEVSLITLSSLNFSQRAGTLTTAAVEQAVWASLR